MSASGQEPTFEKFKADANRYVAITAKGLQQTLDVAPEAGAAVWGRADAMSEQVYKMHSAA